MEKHTVFISHAHADNVLCDAYAKALAELGLDVWYDRANMEYAQLISETIGKELKQRTALVIMLTPNAVASAWVNLEIATYLAYWTKDHSKRIILPVMLADCESPPLLESFKRIDVSIMSQQEAIDTIARTLGVEPRQKQPAGRPAWVYDDDWDDSYTTPDASPRDQAIAAWLSYIEEKWRLVNDSQLGWKPLRGRWNGWEDIFGDTFPQHEPDSARYDSLARRFENSRAKGAAASAVAAFLNDLQSLRQMLIAYENGDEIVPPQRAAVRPVIPKPAQEPARKSSRIRNPLIVDAD